jgi:hypothetical protein
VKPLLLVSTVTPLIVAVFTVLAAAAGLLLLPLPAGDEEAAPDELHAASAAVAAAAAGRASSIRSRAWRPLVRCALSLLPRPAIVRIMTSCPLCRIWTDKHLCFYDAR